MQDGPLQLGMLLLQMHGRLLKLLGPRQQWLISLKTDGEKTQERRKRRRETALNGMGRIDGKDVRNHRGFRERETRRRLLRDLREEMNLRLNDHLGRRPQSRNPRRNGGRNTLQEGDEVEAGVLKGEEMIESETLGDRYRNGYYGLVGVL